MDKDEIKGKVKDVAGRVQSQAGEWTDDPEQHAKGAAKQAEGKVQNAWGQAKDKAKDMNDRSSKPAGSVPEDDEANEPRKTGT